MTEQHFDELPPHVKDWLKDLDVEDIASIKEGMKLVQSAKTVGRFWKWTFIAIVAVFTTAATLGQALEWLWSRLVKGV